MNLFVRTKDGRWQNILVGVSKFKNFDWNDNGSLKLNVRIENEK
jgi:hypothetical protein